MSNQSGHIIPADVSALASTELSSTSGAGRYLSVLAIAQLFHYRIASPISTAHGTGVHSLIDEAAQLFVLLSDF